MTNKNQIPLSYCLTTFKSDLYPQLHHSLVADLLANYNFTNK